MFYFNILNYTFLKVALAGLILFFSYTLRAQDNVIKIEGMYATSTALPYEDYSISKIFDQDEDTYWKTHPGAAIDEGIMIIFDKPTYIRSIKPIFAQGESLDLIKSIAVYGDGMSFWRGENIDVELSSLYIRISSTENESYLEDNRGSKRYTRLIFPGNLAVGISELEIYGIHEEKLEVIPPNYQSGNITVSSSLKPDIAYGADNLMDGRKEFAWAEGNESDGIGEKITFNFDKETTIESIKLWNGYQRSPKHFSSNTRLKQFSFGSKSQGFHSYTIEDIDGAQTVKLTSPIKASQFSLKVEAIYPGSKYKDLVISEIHFANGNSTILLSSASTEKKVEELRELSNPVLKKFLDRNTSVRLSEDKSSGGRYESQTTSNSIIIRSNNTFVLYQRESTYIEDEDDYVDDNKEVISDGGWELIEATATEAKIRIFGKIYSPTTLAELYKGDVTSDNVRIFQDYLTLTMNKISGQKFVEDIIIK